MYNNVLLTVNTVIIIVIILRARGFHFKIKIRVICTRLYTYFKSFIHFFSLLLHTNFHFKMNWWAHLIRINIIFMQ